MSHRIHLPLSSLQHATSFSCPLAAQPPPPIISRCCRLIDAATSCPLVPPADCHDASCRTAAASCPLNNPPPLVCKCSPPVGLLFASWLSCHPCCHAAAASCPLDTLPPPLVLLTCHLRLKTSPLCLVTCRPLLSAGVSPLVCLSFAGWFSHIISLRHCLKCPSSTPAFIHTGWLLRLISSCCFCLLSSHQHRRLLMRWQLTSHLPLVHPNWLPVHLTWYAQ